MKHVIRLLTAASLCIGSASVAACDGNCEPPNSGETFGDVGRKFLDGIELSLGARLADSLRWSMMGVWYLDYHRFRIEYSRDEVEYSRENQFEAVSELYWNAKSIGQGYSFCRSEALQLQEACGAFCEESNPSEEAWQEIKALVDALIAKIDDQPAVDRSQFGLREEADCFDILDILASTLASLAANDGPLFRAAEEFCEPLPAFVEEYPEYAEKAMMLEMLAPELVTQQAGLLLSLAESLREAASQFRADPIGAEIKEWVEFLELFSHFPEMDEEDE
ncbi:MAG: hypothetical protein KDK78_08585 [Chlamydiia bacterium]|nr:hypothetical protein [Chlamydiia bacterium]